MRYELIVAGVSWGGLRALGRILPGLPPGFALPLVVIQHRSPGSPAGALVSALSPLSPLPVKEVEDKDPIEPGVVHIAPADYHLNIESGYFSLSTDAAVDFARPSIDVSFETAADAYGEHLVAVVLTGANEDGARGIAHVKRNGGLVIAQHPRSAERAAMPEAAIATGLVDHVAPLDQIAPLLVELVDRSLGEAS